jgi:hypothetical protein
VVVFVGFVSVVFEVVVADLDVVVGLEDVGREVPGALMVDVVVVEPTFFLQLILAHDK